MSGYALAAHDATVTYHRGIAYFKSYGYARALAEWLRVEGSPDARVVEYDRGFAVQYRVSGPYFPEVSQ